jgi:hypothetical protein
MPSCENCTLQLRHLKRQKQKARLLFGDDDLVSAGGLRPHSARTAREANQPRFLPEVSIIAFSPRDT